MPGLGRLTPGSQFYQSSGESTPEAKLPVKFITQPPAESPIAGHLPTAAGFTPHGPQAIPVVQRAERMVGMRYLYAFGHRSMPIQRLGADGPPNPWTSAFQRMLHGPIHDAGFNDALYQAGYGGFNLGLSFKVPTLPQNVTVPTRGVQKSFNITQKLTRSRRATGQPKGT
jgi:hypothetical protein